jgi:mannose-6-phosphate isomerase-like protein (cupin superfamily)
MRRDGRLNGSTRPAQTGEWLLEDVFPEVVRHLPEADIPLDGVTAYLCQATGHQILFMEFSRDLDVPPHKHGAQWGVVLSGAIALTIDGVEHTYGRGDHYFIEAGVEHSARIRSGYADITFFDEPDRYSVRHGA